MDSFEGALSTQTSNINNCYSPTGNSSGIYVKNAKITAGTNESKTSFWAIFNLSLVTVSMYTKQLFTSVSVVSGGCPLVAPFPFLGWKVLILLSYK